jgi:hypothetical protein
VSVLLVTASFVTVAGALVAISGRDARIALVGLLVALVAAPFLADPLPAGAALGVRIVAALLGGYLLFMTLRDTSAATRGSLAGLPAETLAAAAAYVIGYGTSGLGSTPLGPAEASATGFALAVISVAPIVRGADVFRLGVALAILVTGAELVRVGLAGTPSPLEQLMTAGLTVGLLGTVAVLCANTVAATGGLALRNEPRRSALFEAHPITPTAASSLRGSLLPGWRPRRRAADAESTRPSDAHRIAPPAVTSDAITGPATPAPARSTRTGARGADSADSEQLPLALDEGMGLAELAILRGLDETPNELAAAQPTGAGEPVGAAEPGETAIPGEAIAPEEQVERDEPATPTEPVERDEPATPTEPVERDEPATPTEPVERDDSGASSEPPGSAGADDPSAP